MITIDIEYRSWWCPWKRRCRSWAPSLWHEMDQRQFLAIVKSILGQITQEQYFAELFGIPTRLVAKLDQWHVYILNKQVRWLEQGKSETSRFFVRQICGLYAPQDALNGVTLQQFMTADTFFSNFVATIDQDTATSSLSSGSTAALARFVASLYMRRNETYFIDNMPPQRTALLFRGKEEKLVDIEGNAAMLEKKADQTLLWAVYLNWVMLRNWLARAFPLLFPEGDPEDKGSKNQQRVKNAWLNIFDSFVGDDIAHLDNYRQLACTDAFRLMNRRIKEAASKK